MLVQSLANNKPKNKIKPRIDNIWQVTTSWVDLALDVPSIQDGGMDCPKTFLRWLMFLFLCYKMSSAKMNWLVLDSLWNIFQQVKFSDSLTANQHCQAPTPALDVGCVEWWHQGTWGVSGQGLSFNTLFENLALWKLWSCHQKTLTEKRLHWFVWSLEEFIGKVGDCDFLSCPQIRVCPEPYGSHSSDWTPWTKLGKQLHSVVMTLKFETIKKIRKVLFYSFIPRHVSDNTNSAIEISWSGSWHPASPKSLLHESWYGRRKHPPEVSSEVQ